MADTDSLTTYKYDQKEADRSKIKLTIPKKLKFPQVKHIIKSKPTKHIEDLFTLGSSKNFMSDYNPFSAKIKKHNFLGLGDLYGT